MLEHPEGEIAGIGEIGEGAEPDSMAVDSQAGVEVCRAVKVLGKAGETASSLVGGDGGLPVLGEGGSALAAAK